MNESFAHKFWRGGKVLGKHIRLLKNHVAQPWLTVIGVLPDILQNPNRPVEHDPLIYLPYSEEPQRDVFIVSLTSVPPQTLASALRREVQNLDPNLALYDSRSLESQLAQARLSTTLLGGVFSVFAGIALALAAIGMYAVIAHSVSQRTQEIGVRMALGGSRQDIMRLVYGQGMRPVILGIAIGLPAAFGIAHLLRTVLVGVSPGDPVTLFSVVVVLVIAGLAGCVIPARRAVRVDPVVALRYE